MRLYPLLMLNLLWSLLNLLLLAGVGYILFRAGKLVRQHMGRGAWLFFVFALLAVGCRKTSSSPASSRNLLAKTQHKPIANTSAIQRVSLGVANTLALVAVYNVDNGVMQPRELYATVSGLLLGHEWEPVMGSLRPQGSQLRYFAVLNHHWLLLNMRVFTQGGEEFEGIMPPARQI